MTKAGKRDRSILSLFGPIDVVSQTFETTCCRARVVPIDYELDLAPQAGFTTSVMKRGVLLGARLPFETSEEVMREMFGFAMSRSEIDRCCRGYGEKIDKARQDRDEAFLKPISPQDTGPTPLDRPERLVLMADAVTVLTVKGEEHKSVYCGRAFDLGARGVKDGSLRPFLADSRVCASGEDMEHFSGRLKAFAFESGLRACRQVAFVADGARCLWDWAYEALPEDAVLIQDFWHVCEHLSDLAKTLYDEDWESWFERWKVCLWEGFVDELIRDLERERKRFRGKKRESLDGQIHYLAKGSKRMAYARFRREGWPVGSGAIESTCKHLIKTRFNVTGARWRRKHIPAMAALRVSIQNKTFEEDWQSAIAA